MSFRSKPIIRANLRNPVKPFSITMIFSKIRFLSVAFADNPFCYCMCYASINFVTTARFCCTIVVESDDHRYF